MAEEVDGYELTPEQEEGIHASRRSIAEGRGVAWETVRAELEARLAARGR
jgi:hypothetical protein